MLPEQYEPYRKQLERLLLPFEVRELDWFSKWRQFVLLINFYSEYMMKQIVVFR